MLIAQCSVLIAGNAEVANLNDEKLMWLLGNYKKNLRIQNVI